eukprot:6646818-Pyramimonas_sp.AAC.1
MQRQDFPVERHVGSEVETIQPPRRSGQPPSESCSGVQFQSAPMMKGISMPKRCSPRRARIRPPSGPRGSLSSRYTVTPKKPPSMNVL